MEGLPALVKHSLHSTFEVLPTSSPSASSAPLQGHAQQIQHQLACLQSCSRCQAASSPNKSWPKAAGQTWALAQHVVQVTRWRGAPPLHERGTIGEAGWCRGSALRESGRKNRPSIGRTGVGHVGPLSPAPHTHEAFVPSAIVP